VRKKALNYFAVSYDTNIKLKTAYPDQLMQHVTTRVESGAGLPLTLVAVAEISCLPCSDSASM